MLGVNIRLLRIKIHISTQTFVSDCRLLCREYITAKISSEKGRLVGIKTLNICKSCPYFMPAVAELCLSVVKEQCYISGQFHNVSMLPLEHNM